MNTYLELPARLNKHVGADDEGNPILVDKGVHAILFRTDEIGVVLPDADEPGQVIIRTPMGGTYTVPEPYAKVRRLLANATTIKSTVE